MTDYTVYGRITVRYTGLFDLDSLFAAVVSWAKNQGYMWHEKTFKHKVPSPRGSEQEFTWVLTKKVTDYVSFQIVLTGNVWDLKVVEVEVDGKKKKLSSARLYIWIDCKILTDWQKRFAKGGKFTQWMGRKYEDWILEKTISSKYYDIVWYRAWDLQALLKKYFDMQTKHYAFKGYIKED